MFPGDMCFFTVYFLHCRVTCYIYTHIPGNVLGMIGVSSGIAATIGILKPEPDVLMQMLACMGVGKI